jgi:RNA polymerase sigma-70 factor (ECF subfamily)
MLKSPTLSEAVKLNVVVYSTVQHSTASAEFYPAAHPRHSELAALITRIASGDQGALGDLYERTKKQVYGLALRILRNAATAEEVLTDVYLQVWRQASHYDARRGRPFTWLATIARSRALDRLRSGKPEEQWPEEIEAADVVAHSSGIEEAVAANERRRIVIAALEALSTKEREVIELAYFSGLTQREMATQLGQPLGTVKTRVRRALTKLRETLRPSMELLR